MKRTTTSTACACACAALALLRPALAAEHKIFVGPNGALSFAPQSITADKGDTLTFAFTAWGEHAVVQSTFDTPCEPAKGGFSTGPMVYQQEYSTTVSTTGPMWFYDASSTHCQAGSVFAVNADGAAPNSNSTNVGNHTFIAFRQNALDAPSSAVSTVAPARRTSAPLPVVRDFEEERDAASTEQALKMRSRPWWA